LGEYKSSWIFTIRNYWRKIRFQNTDAIENIPAEDGNDGKEKKLTINSRGCREYKFEGSLYQNQYDESGTTTQQLGFINVLNVAEHEKGSIILKSMKIH
jgi:hypothetical protein